MRFKKTKWIQLIFWQEEPETEFFEYILFFLFIHRINKNN